MTLTDVTRPLNSSSTSPTNTALADVRKSGPISGNPGFVEYCVQLGLDAIEGEIRKYLFRIRPSSVTLAKSNREEPRLPSKA